MRFCPLTAEASRLPGLSRSRFHHGWTFNPSHFQIDSVAAYFKDFWDRITLGTNELHRPCLKCLRTTLARSSEAGLHVGGVTEHVGKGQVGQGPFAKRRHLLVETRADSRYLGLGDSGVDAERLDQIVDIARRDPVDVGLHDDGVEDLVDAPAALEHARKETALAEFGDLQLDVASLGRDQSRS